MRWIAAIACVALAASGAQQEVDFSGRWILKSPAAATDAPRSIVVDQHVAPTSVRSERKAPIFPAITIRRESASGVVTVETRSIGLTGGFVSGTRSSVPQRTHTGTTWEGRRLVFSGGTYTGFEPRTGTWTEHREVWSITAKGSLSIEIVIESSESTRHAQKLEYVRTGT